MDDGFRHGREGPARLNSYGQSCCGLREKAGLSQKDLARKLKTSQQQISRLESPTYEGHSLSMLRRVARVLKARVRVVLEPDTADSGGVLAEDAVPYRIHSNSKTKLPKRKPRR